MREAGRTAAALPHAAPAVSSRAPFWPLLPSQAASAGPLPALPPARPWGHHIVRCWLGARRKTLPLEGSCAGVLLLDCAFVARVGTVWNATALSRLEIAQGHATPGGQSITSCSCCCFLRSACLRLRSSCRSLFLRKAPAGHREAQQRSACGLCGRVCGAFCRKSDCG